MTGFVKQTNDSVLINFGYSDQETRRNVSRWNEYAHEIQDLPYVKAMRDGDVTYVKFIKANGVDDCIAKYCRKLARRTCTQIATLSVTLPRIVAEMGETLSETAKEQILSVVVNPDNVQNGMAANAYRAIQAMTIANSHKDDASILAAMTYANELVNKATSDYRYVKRLTDTSSCRWSPSREAIDNAVDVLANIDTNTQITPAFLIVFARTLSEVCDEAKQNEAIRETTVYYNECLNEQ